jgi:hypothetical protein
MEKVENCLKKKCGPSMEAYTMFILEMAVKYSKQLRKIRAQKDSGKITKVQYYEKYDRLLKEAQEDTRYKAYNACARSKCKSAFRDQILVLIELCGVDEKYKYYREVFEGALGDGGVDIAENADFVKVLKGMRRYFMDTA